MELNDKNLEVLAAGLKIAKEDLTKALTEAEAEEIKIPSHIYTDEEYQILDKNRSNEEYFKGKTANEEMTLKEQKKNIKEVFGLETEGIKDINSLFKLIADSKDSHYKELLKDSGNKESEKFLSKISELEGSNEELRTKLTSAETEFQTQLQERDKNIKSSQINNELLKVASSIQFAIPNHVSTQGKEKEAEYIKTETENYLTLLKSNYKFDIIEGKVVTYEGENLIKDRLEQPENIQQIALEFAKSRNFNLKDNTVINRGSSQKYGNLFHGMTEEEFSQLLEKENLHPNSLKALAYRKEYMEKNK